MAKTDLDNAILEEAALRRYLQLIDGAMRGYEREAVARRAYQDAKAFAEVTELIRAGEAIPERAKEDRQLYAKVHLWNMAAGDKGEPMNDNNGRPIVEIQPVDRFSFAPNLPERHPINQRYYPTAARLGILCERDGTPVQVH